MRATDLHPSPGRLGGGRWRVLLIVTATLLGATLSLALPNLGIEIAGAEAVTEKPNEAR